jgi:hypothetical protein
VTDALPVSSIAASYVAESLCEALQLAHAGNFYHAGTRVGTARAIRDGLRDADEKARASKLIGHVSTHIFLMQPDPPRKAVPKVKLSTAQRVALECVRDFGGTGEVELQVLERIGLPADNAGNMSRFQSTNIERIFQALARRKLIRLHADGPRLTSRGRAALEAPRA